MRTPACRVVLLLAGALLRADESPDVVDLLPGPALEGWRGGDTFDPRALAAMPAAEREAKVTGWTAEARRHWRVEGRELVTTGKGPCLATLKDYGDVEFQVEYRISPKGDSGIYLRNIPQVQIWDPEDRDAWKHGAKLGSGGLWNNSPDAPGKDPAVRADRPAGEWNALRVVQLGERVSVWLNDRPVVDHARLENYFDRARPIPARGPLVLQSHGDAVTWRNLRLREIPSEEANRRLAAKDDAGFVPLFDGESLAGWKGAVADYEVVPALAVCGRVPSAQGTLYAMRAVPALIRCRSGKGGTLFTERTFADFVLRLEFRLPKGGNNGLALRYPGAGNPAYDGFAECQVLDDAYEAATGQKIDPRQAHGSAYGMAAAARGYQRPIGEWNFQEVTLVGKRLKVELNGTVILDADLGKADARGFMGGLAHPGLARTAGHIGFAGHGDPVEFREIKVREIKTEPETR